ncbi:MAG: acyltransferase [Clostridia bacterium]|nr:acyltransferase [Clostridia bacterium]
MGRAVTSERCRDGECARVRGRAPVEPPASTSNMRFANPQYGSWKKPLDWGSPVTLENRLAIQFLPSAESELVLPNSAIFCGGRQPPARLNTSGAYTKMIFYGRWIDKMTQAQLGRFAFIDGWRVLAVACVIFAHASLTPQIGDFLRNHSIGIVSEYGEVGVFIFFFISGYVVSTTCFKEVGARSNFSTQAFYARRAFRIIPPLMLYLLTCLLLGKLNYIDFSFTNFASSSLYLCNTTIADCGWYSGHTWSLAFEEQFYLLFPIIFSYIELRKKPRFFPLIIIIAITSMPLVFSVFWIGKTGFFIIHLLFWLGYFSAKHPHGVYGFFKDDRFGSIVLIASTLAVFLPTSIIFPSTDYDTHLIIGKYYKFIYILAIPLMVLLSGRTGSISLRILSNNFLSHLGRATYSIYLWQQLLTGSPIRESGARVQIFLIVAMIFLCSIMYDTVEIRLTQLGINISSRIKRREDLSDITKKDVPIGIQSGVG